MCATATAILHWNAIPVFADIDRQTFNIDPQSIEENITKYTKAILAVDIFGHSADMDKIMSIAKRYSLKVISDTAQSPGAMYKGKFAGTLADIGGYSLNYHKHIHTGEGGVLVTDDDALADRMRLIRNHAEAVVKDKGIKNLRNMLGYNFRLGEIECAIGIEQLKKLKGLVEQKQNLAERLSEGIKYLKGLEIPIVRPQCTHSYYIYGIILNIEEIGVSRDKIVKALRAEGVEVSSKYANLHLLPLYQEKIAYGSKGFPWVDNICKRDVNYRKGICQIAEKLNDESYIGIEMCAYDLDSSDIDLIIGAFRKVWNNLGTLA
jgi:dTDP-4-amino-4,6-dideoxygalactose transaminase